MSERKSIGNTFTVSTIEDATLVTLAPNPSTINFAWDDSTSAYAPTEIRLQCGFIITEGETNTTYIGNVSDYTTLYNKFQYRAYRRARKSDNTFTNWGAWGISTIAINVQNSTTNLAYEFALSTATSAGEVADSNIVTRIVVPVLKGGEKGAQGKMSRNIYFAGMWTDGDVRGASFTVTDNSAPYVQLGWKDNAHTIPYCKVFEGENGSYNFPTSYDDYLNSSVWKDMETDFKYLMVQAVFAAFAKLGSWIFNGDYMFSQKGIDGTTNYQNFTGEDGAWQPNLYMNARTGRLVANDIVLRGVLNNMINSISSTNWNSFGYYEHTGTTVEDLQGNLYLNPLKCGQYIDFDFSSHDLTIVLPSYCVESTSLPKKDATHNFTLTELRQMVGKSIVIMPKGMGQSAPSLRSNVMYERVEDYNDGWLDLGYKNGGSSVADGDTTTITCSLQRTNTYDFAVTSQSFILRAVCKTGQYRNRECIYWEVNAIQAAG